MLGFDVQDAIALLRLDDLYLDSFVVTDGESDLPLSK
jgi:predicted RNA-binding protein associated with RNAse of E/G family